VTSPKLIKPIEAATLGVSLGTLAQMQHIAPDVLVSRLQQHGVIARVDKSVRETAVANQVKEDRLLAIFFRID
jgi:EAL domain-containing protein (putative c-di-GMP-specific phosphodiesterase class I)